MEILWKEPLSRLANRLSNLDDAHYINVLVRRNGKDEIYEADELRVLHYIVDAIPKN